MDATAAAGAAGAGVLAALAYYLTDPRRPTAASFASGWWTFSDQQRYLRSTLAWAAGRLDPAEHWYMPGYPLLAVPFLRLTHANPFLLPNLALLMATICLAAALAAWLAPAWRWARPAGAAVALASVLPARALDAWVTPWTSTPETPLTLAALLASLHLLARPTAWPAAFCAGLCAGALLAFRPVDAVVVSSAVLLAWLLAMVRAWPGWAMAATTAAAALAGAALAMASTLAAYWVINGWHLNGYLILSAAIGFEWRLLPLRWVTIMLSPRPLFADGAGMIARFPWIATGIAGMAACIVKPPASASRLAHLLVAGAVIVHVTLYLCYRDLQPQGLWRYYNYHYFKWALVVFAIYSLLLVRLVVERRWRALVTGAALVAALLPWRAELVRDARLPVAVQSGSVLRFPPLSLGVFDALAVPAAASFDAIFNTQQNLYVGPHEEKWYSSTADFRASPQPGGLMIAPLRPLLAGPVTIYFGAGVNLGPGAAQVAHQRLVFGLPCWRPLHVKGCS